MVGVDAVLVIGQRSGELHRALTGACAGEWGVGVGERGIAGGGGLAGGVGGGGLARADGEPGAEVDELGEDELLAPPAPSK
jgi:hypothetical protein